jgi:molybdopterin molybdotransferase
MISVYQAKQIIGGQDFTPSTREIPLAGAVNRILAEPVHATCDIPAFLQSSMDGFAFRFRDWQRQLPLTVAAQVPAGCSAEITLPAGQAARIFTGAPLPAGADTVVMQEKAVIKEDRLVPEDGLLRAGQNTRAAGAEICRGELALDRGAFLSPAAIGFLASIGTCAVTVYTTPRVALIVTGNELQDPGRPLLRGRVYEACSFMLRAALEQMDIREVSLYRAEDSLQAVTSLLETAIEDHDMVLLTGGVSVGDYDFVVRASERCGVTQLFHKVRQRPGKPLFFGRKGSKPVFGLPGNPSSVLTCFYEYVWPVIRRLDGHADGLLTLKVPLTTGYDKKNELTQFLKGHYRDGGVAPLAAQESFRLSSFAGANCLICLDENTSTCRKGDLVEIHLLPVYR